MTTEITTRLNFTENIYQPPEFSDQEMIVDDIIGFKADSWSIGILIYYMWKLKLPFIK